MNTFNFTSFHETPAIGILRNFTKDQITIIADTYERAGLSSLEITLNSPDALDCISHFSNKHSNLNIGAGTVCTINELEDAISAGASFIVSPICDLTLIRKAKARNIPVFPGALTPSEIYQAWQAGATAVKVFPASAFGPKYIREVKAPLSEIQLMPTGGITTQNMLEYFQAGAMAVGMGSALVGKTDKNQIDTEMLYQSMLKIYQILKGITSPGNMK